MPKEASIVTLPLCLNGFFFFFLIPGTDALSGFIRVISLFVCIVIAADFFLSYGHIFDSYIGIRMRECA